jgi:hypothetical protein
MTIEYEWRGAFGNDEFHVLHAEAFETRIFDDDLLAFYFDACGFRPTNAGLIALQP